jgi:HK97 family phage prohead protease
MLLYKNLSQGISDVDVKKGIVTGYFSSFDNMDSDGDVIRKGAFTKTINENFQRVRHLLDHDATKSVGKILSLKEDNKGLYYESKAGRHTLGRDFLLMVEDGLISEHSIGFVTIKQKKMGHYNEISEVKLYEGSSLQGWGANEMTPITGMKSYENISFMMDNIMRAIKGGKYTDETFAKLELQFLQLQKELNALKELSVETPEPSEDKGCVTVTINIEDTEEHEYPMEDEPMAEEEVAPAEGESTEEGEQVEEEAAPAEESNMEVSAYGEDLEEDEYELILNGLIESYQNGKS